MTRSLFLCGGLALACAILAGCQQRRGTPPPPPPPVVSVAHPVGYPVQVYYEYNGTLEAIETVQITARVKGFLDEITFTEGEEVQRDDLLFKIDPREYVAAERIAEADKKKAAAELSRATREADRARGLRATGAVSAEEAEQRFAAQETAAALLLQAEAALDARRLQRSFTEIHSPIDGQISRALVTRGNLVGQNENTLLTTVVRMDPLFVFFDAPERDLVQYQRSLRAGEQASVTSRTLPVEIGVTTEDGYPHPGKIDFRENRVDPGTGTVRVRGRIPNPRVPPGNARLLYPGLYARVRVPAGPPQTLPAIPEDALMTGQEGRFVYVLDENNVVQKRSVTVGPQVWKDGSGVAAGWTRARPDKDEQPTAVASVVAIEKGLSAADRVIINGLTKARPGSPVVPEVWVVSPPLAEQR